MEDVLEYFDSITEFAKTIKTRKQNPVMRGCDSSEAPDANGWYGTQDMDEAEKFLKCGDIDKLSAFTKVDGGNGFTNYNDKTTRQIRYSERGSAVSVSRYLQGDPNCMRRIQRVHRKDNVVSIVYQCNMTADYTSEEIESNGRKIAAIVKSLESSGYRVSLFVASCSKCNKQYRTCIVKVKDSGQPLNVLALTYPICNTSMFRRHFFKALETCPEELKSGWSSGYGTSESNSRIVKQKIGTRIKGAFRLLTSYELLRINNDKDLMRYLNLR